MTEVEWLERVESTNAELVGRERSRPQAHLTAIATLDQTNGRGRLGRTWSAPPGASLALSVVIRPDGIPPERLGLVTLIAGVAARAAIAARLPERPVTLKWPNDVLVGARKIAGILAEVEPSGGAVVLGIGINTAMTATQLPVSNATSIAIESDSQPDAELLASELVADVIAELSPRIERFRAARGDLELSGLRTELEAACGTLGERVAVQLPDGSTLTGIALGIGPDGSLLVAADGSEQPTAILAGDVTHLRYQ